MRERQIREGAVESAFWQSVLGKTVGERMARRHDALSDDRRATRVLGRFARNGRPVQVWRRGLFGQGRRPLDWLSAGEIPGTLVGIHPHTRNARFVQKYRENHLSSGWKSPKLYTIFISNWTRYQSEYERQKKSRTKRVTPDYRDKLQAKLQARTRERYTTEGEVEVDKNHCANPAGSHDGVSSPQPLIALEHLDAVRRVWEYYLEKLKKSAKLLTFTPLRKSKGLARLRECLAKTAGDLELAEGLMRVAVDVVAASPWHCGENPQRKRYDSWEKNLFKSQDQLEEWLAKS